MALQPEATGPTVIVGIDGTATAALAADWAAAWAVRQSTPLVLLTAQGHEIPPMSDPAVQTFGRQAQRVGVASARDTLDDIRFDLEHRHPGLQARVQVEIGSPVRVLREVSGPDAVLVIGNRGRSVWTAALSGDTSDAVVTRPRGPVVVINGPTPPVWDRPVVLGVQLDGAHRTPRSAVDFAFAQAKVFEQSVQVVVVEGDGVPPAQDGLDTLVARRSPGTEDVAWRAERVRADVVPELVARSGHASLLVVGSRGKTALSGLVSGSTSRELVSRAQCPVAVVPEHH